MRFIKPYLILTLLYITISGCDIFDDSPCGPNNVYDLYLLGPDIVDSSTGVLHSYMEGTNRVIQWSAIVEEACTDEHVKLNYRVALLDETITGVTARGSASWQFLFEKSTPLTKNGSDLKGELEVGLKQAFPDLKGWFIPTLEVIFPTKGSYSADTAFLKANVISVEMMAKYRDFKE